VYHDVLKYTADYRDKRFVKTYADIGAQIRQGILEYVTDVKNRSFPAEEHVFRADQGVQESLGTLYGKGKVEVRS